MKQAWSADPARINWQFNRRNVKDYGMASLPGDITHLVDREIPPKASSLHLRDAPVSMYLTEQMRRPGNDRLFVEEAMDGARSRNYDQRDMESLRQHDMERASDMARQSYVRVDQRDYDRKSLREQHFYREGNAEVMRLVTRGVAGETTATMHRQPEILIDASVHRIDGKDILLRRFIEDQKLRVVGQDFHDSMQELERHSMESHQRQKEAVMHQQQEILLIPENLEQDHRQHIEEVGPDVQRLIIDHGTYEKSARSDIKESQDILSGTTLIIHGPMQEAADKAKEQAKSSANLQHYSIHDLELARQNALLTRLLLERDRGVGGIIMDSGSYLETQSLPGQVATGTQTNHTAATQTEHHSRSRSDNDESEEDAQMRRKMKSKKRYGDGEPKRIRTLWMRSPIREDDQQYTEKRTNILRRKMKDIKDGRQISIEPEVLQEISDSLDETGGTPQATRQRFMKSSNSRYETRKDEAPQLEDSSSVEMYKNDYKKLTRERSKEKMIDEDERSKRREHASTIAKDNVPEPSFRILEREMSSLNKKLTKLAETRRFESEGESRDTENLLVIDSNEEKHQPTEEYPQEKLKSSKTIEISKIKRSKVESSSKEEPKTSDGMGSDKSQMRSKYRRKLPISTASSELEEIIDKPKKSNITKSTEAEKTKLLERKSGHSRLRRQMAVVEHRDLEKPVKIKTINTGKRKEIALRRSVKVEKKSAKSETESDHAGKDTTTADQTKTTEKLIGKGNFKDGDRDQQRVIDGSSSKHSDSSPHVSKQSERTKDFFKSNRKTSSNYAETSQEIPKSLSDKSPTKSMKSTTDTGSVRSDKQSTSSSTKPSVETSPEFVKTTTKGTEEISEMVSEETDRSEKYLLTKSADVVQTTVCTVKAMQKMVKESQNNDGSKADTIKSTVIDSVETISTRSSPPVKLSKKIEDDTQKAVLKTIERTRSIIDDAQNVAKKVVDDVNSKVIDSLKDLINSHQIISKSEKNIKEDHETIEPVQVLSTSPIVIPESPEKSPLKTPPKIVSPIITTEVHIPINVSEKIEEIDNVPIVEPPESSPMTVTTENSKILLEKSEIELKTREILSELIAPLTMNISSPKSTESSSLSPKPIVISRETSFLNSPKRQSVDETHQPLSSPRDLNTTKELTQTEPHDILIAEAETAHRAETSIEECKQPEFNAQTLDPSVTVLPEGLHGADASLDILEDDSDVSSESSSRTAFIARPYGTPRHRRLVRMENMESEEGLNSSIEELEMEAIKKDELITSSTKEMPILNDVAKYDDSKEVLRESQPMEKNLTDESYSLTSVDKSELSDHIEVELKSEVVSKEFEPSKDQIVDDTETTEINIDKKIGGTTVSEIFAGRNMDDNVVAESSVDEKVDDTEATTASGQMVPIQDLLPSPAQEEALKQEIEAIKIVNLPLSQPEEKVKTPEIKSTDDNHEMPDLDTTKETRDEEQEKVELITKPDKDKLADVDSSTCLADETESLEKEKKKPKVPEINGKISDTTELFETKKCEDLVHPAEPERTDKSMDSTKEQPTKASKNREPSKERLKTPGKTFTTKTLKKPRKEESQSIKGHTEIREKPSQSRDVLRRQSKITELHPDQTESKSTAEQARPRKSLERSKNIKSDHLRLEKSKKSLSSTDEKSTIRSSKDRVPERDHKAIDDALPKKLKNVNNKMSKLGTSKKSSSSSERDIDDSGQKQTHPETKIDKPSTASVTEENLTTANKTLACEPEQHSNNTLIDKFIDLPTDKQPINLISPSESIMVLMEQDQQQITSDRKPSTERDRSTSPKKIIKHYKDEHTEAQSRYMAWYKQNRDDTERKRQEKREGEDDELPPKWLRKSTRQRWLKMSPEDRKIFENLRTPETTPQSHRRIKPLVNVESEQLKAIVRQGRKLRRAEGSKSDDVSVEIFAPDKPPTPPIQPPPKYHYLVQHSEYNYERIPPPFYLHPPPVPHPTPQASPQPFEVPTQSLFVGVNETRRPEQDRDIDILVSLQGGGRLRHQQLLEKKSVFDIAYSEAAPSHLRADSTTPPS